LLAERGVSLGGATGSTRTPPPAPVAVGAVHSPPLIEILRYMVQRSDNHIADAMFRTIGAHTTGAGGWHGAAEGVAGALADLGLDWSGTSLADGSGLSRDDRLTPRFLTSLDAAMTGSSLGPQWQSLMAVTGESGTLLRRAVGTVAQGRVRAKTGTLNDVRALAGTVAGPAHTRYHFAVLGNALDADGRRAVLTLQDRLVITLADDLLGCPRIVEVPPHLRGAHDDPAYDCAA
jgi:serine-type D-Ala-D-Ala carboxypeptidase/endopeptidase (penicillin-binding protein 4)